MPAKLPRPLSLLIEDIVRIMMQNNLLALNCDFSIITLVGQFTYRQRIDFDVIAFEFTEHGVLILFADTTVMIAPNIMDILAINSPDYFPIVAVLEIKTKVS